MATHAPHSENQPHALLLACGNTFRGDDGVGWCICRAIEEQLQFDGLTVMKTRQLLPEHAQAVSAADVVVFVDCSSVAAAGTVSTIPIEPAATLPPVLTHHLEPAALLRLSADLYERIPARAIAITVGGESFDWTDRLSRRVKSAVPEAMEAVRTALLGIPELEPLLQGH
ncbi:MAG TPA: hydrogenase maturation protease [Acidobacteriaceae bacterium]